MEIPNANSKAFMTVLLMFAVDLTALAFPDETRLRMPGRARRPEPARFGSVRCVDRGSLVDRIADAFTAQSHDRSSESSISSAFSIDDHEYVIWNEAVITTMK